MTSQTFTAKGAQTKEIKAILGAGFKVRTNGVCTIISGDVAEAKALLAGFAAVFDFADLGGGLAVWQR